MGAAAGLNISSWLKHSQDGGGRGQWLREWRKKGVGEVTVWLHTRAPIVPAFSHSFMLEDSYQDKDTGKNVPVLRFPRFISPDTEIVHRNQYFREEDGSLKVPPDRDPFLILREWLRTPAADGIGLEDPVFKWEHPKERKVIVWERGPICGLVKRGKSNFGHSLDTRIEYVYVVVDDDDIASGPVLMREGKLLSQKISEVVKQQQKQFGETEGDPTQHPYAFLLMAEDASVPMNAFKCVKAERAEFTDEVWEQISGEEYPDPVPYSEPGDGDMQKIRDAMEAAAQVDLPLDAIFSDDAQVRRDLTRRGAKIHTAGAPRQSKAAQARSAASPAERPPVPSNSNAAAPKPSAAAATGRRKKAEPAPAQPPPEPEMISCDDCGHLMKLTDTKCGGCGAEYEVDEAAVAPELSSIDETEPEAEPEKPKTPPKPKPTPASAKPAAATTRTAAAPATQAKSSGARPRTRTKQETTASEQPASDDEEGAAGEVQCWACNSLVTPADRNADGIVVCPDCGIEVGDDIPFAYNEVFCGWELGGIGERWRTKVTNRQII